MEAFKPGQAPPDFFAGGGGRDRPAFRLRPTGPWARAPAGCIETLFAYLARLAWATIPKGPARAEFGGLLDPRFEDEVQVENRPPRVKADS